MSKSVFDPTKAHQAFSANCFNATWNLIRKKRTPDEDLRMLHLANTSFWHWSQRADCTARNRSIGYWLLARVHALTGEVDLARRYGQLSLSFSAGEDAFYQAFAYESLARAEMVGGHRRAMARNLAKAKAAWLEENLQTIFLPISRKKPR
jgi:hypothetical protein